MQTQEHFTQQHRCGRSIKANARCGDIEGSVNFSRGQIVRVRVHLFDLFCAQEQIKPPRDHQGAFQIIHKGIYKLADFFAV